MDLGKGHIMGRSDTMLRRNTTAAGCLALAVVLGGIIGAEQQECEASGALGGAEAEDEHSPCWKLGHRWHPENENKDPDCVENLTHVPPHLAPYTPRFVGMGAETTGTSALIDYFGRHASVMVAGEKNFWCWDWDTRRGAKGYLGDFKNMHTRRVGRPKEHLYRDRDTHHNLGDDDEGDAKPEAPKELWSAEPRDTWFAEKSPLYGHYPLSVYRLHASFPNRPSDPYHIKYIYTYRNPIVRSCSRLKKVCPTKRQQIDRGMRYVPGFEPHRLEDEVRKITAYKQCRATHLFQNHVCSPALVDMPRFQHLRGVCEGLEASMAAAEARAPDWSFKTSRDLDRRVSDLLFGGTWSVKEARVIEEDTFFSCHKKFRVISYNIYPSFQTEHLRRWHFVYGKENILMTSQEELLEDPQMVLEQVLDFVGLDPAAAKAMVEADDEHMNHPRESTRVEMAQKRCASSAVNSESFLTLFNESMYEFYELVGKDLHWEEAVIHNQQEPSLVCRKWVE